MVAEEQQITKSEESSVVPEEYQEGPVFRPQVDIIEKKDSVVILADMPGVTRDNVDVVLEQGVLTIEGHVDEQERPDVDFQREEYEVGSFHRRFAVGEGLDVDNVDGTMNDGVLRLTLPKSDRYQPRKIEIKE